MSKAFTKESDGDDDEDIEKEEVITGKNYVTPAGFTALQDELKELMQVERPKIVEVVRWAAGNGDRSENGDYIYGKKRLREIDRRVRYLVKRLESAEVVDPSKQQGLTRIFFGASVTLNQDGTEKTLKIVGIDEADVDQGKISWVSPLAKALLKAEVGDVIKFSTAEGTQNFEILSIKYQT